MPTSNPLDIYIYIYAYGIAMTVPSTSTSTSIYTYNFLGMKGQCRHVASFASNVT